MRYPPRYALAAAIMLLVGCSRDATPDSTSAPAATPPPATTTAPATTAPAPDRVFSQEELDQMVAPIALYPDPLLAQVLMAATYPGDVADAAKWSQAHPDAQGDAAVKQVADQPWDPSVQSLVAFPQALATLGQDSNWVTRLGDAFLAQPDDVMDAVQRLRRQAQAAGNLNSNQYQQVSEQAAPAPVAAPASSGGGTTTVVQAAAEPSTIIIQPTNPQVVYVPTYNPAVVYGSWGYPAYPPYYYPPPRRYYTGNAFVAGLAFGVGVAVVDSLWGGCDWNDNDIDIDVNRYNNINVNRRIDVNNNTWQHNSVNRDGVPYRDRNSRDQHGRQLDGARDRDAFRGEDKSRSDARAQARDSMQKRGVDAPARSNQEAQQRAQAAGRDLKNDAARDRAGAVADRASKAPAGSRDAARDRASAATDRARSNPQGAKDAARSAGATTKANAAQRKPATQSSQRNTQARTAARQQTQAKPAPKNNAFQGASKPAQSHQQAAARGQASRSAAQRPAASRPAAKPVSRPSNPPQRSGANRR